MLLQQVTEAGQAKLAAARVLLVGSGALGSSIADALVRGGVGYLRIVDRDIVELTNLQRQVLFDENDVREGAPKAVAAARRLGAINSQVTIDPVVADAHAGNIEELLSAPDGNQFQLILDGTDNVETRYLLNDVALKQRVPWIYGACVGVEGRVMAVLPGRTPCLRCVYPQPPSAGELQTCDTAGVLGAAVAIVAALQVVAAMKVLLGVETNPQMQTVDAWAGRVRTVNLDDARSGDCPACNGRYEFLEMSGESSTTSLCGRNTVQIRPAKTARLDLTEIARRLAIHGTVQVTRYLIKAELRQAPGMMLTVFADGRALVQGTRDVAKARTLYARYIGT